MSHLLKLEELQRLARRARSDKGLSQYAAAAELNVGQTDIAGAEHSSDGEFLEVQLRMIRELGGYTIEGPFFRLETPKGRQSPI